ncbi:DNA recombination protein RmuC [Pseudoneobacillus sp. C159]
MLEIISIVSILINLIILIFVLIIFQKSGKGQGRTELLAIEKSQEKLERSFREDMGQIRQEIGGSGKQNREELTQILHTVNQSIMATIGQMANQQKNVLDSFTKQLTELTTINEQKLEHLRSTVEQKLSSLQDDNNKKLEQMRQTVDEKLHATLEQRLGESFKQVSDRLELVHKGLGEMQNLANGVGDLKRVLTNVKARGTLGEIQLGSLLEQILSYDQYEANVATKKGSSERVEFAVKLPSKEEKGGSIYIPIDSKFPLEDYQRLLEAQDTGDSQKANDAAKQIEFRIKAEAKSIRDKYINPPATTDFAIMFLPLEGLYAEVLRRPGLWDTLQREYRVIITGPTTLAALLNSLQMGFRTLAIQKRSSEVWELLGAVKTEFGKFGDILDKTQKKLQEASNTIENAARRGRAIERKLRTVEELPSSDATLLLGELEMASTTNME